MIVFDYNDDCLSCNICMNCCPVDAVANDQMLGYYIQYYDLCLIERLNGCEICVGLCPVGCIFNNSEEFENADSIIDREKMFDSFDKWEGNPYLLGGSGLSGIDCSHFVYEVYKEMGLEYIYNATATFSSLSCFFEVDSPIDGDVILWAGHHMGIYVSNPPTSGYHIFGATSSKGVRYGRISWWSRYGNPKYYRYKK